MSRAPARPTFVLHDGPRTPTAHPPGPRAQQVPQGLHREVRTMAGFDSPYVPGWDCHGLPIEIKVDKELGGKKRRWAARVRRACRKYAEKYVEISATSSSASASSGLG